jgi:hypothetical protein
MTPLTNMIEMTTERRKILRKKYCHKENLDNRSLQNILRTIEKKGLLFKKSKSKHVISYGTLLIRASQSFNKAYTSLNLTYISNVYRLQKIYYIKSRYQKKC